MKKLLLVPALLLLLSAAAQDEENKEEEKKGFKKENLFTGGSISLAFYNNTFLIGASPVFGYSVTKWIDAGIVVNYNYTSYRDYNFVFNDKLRQTLYGGGTFVKIYPVRFLFAQGQAEYNFIRQKFIPNVGSPQTYRVEASSLLVGGGYTTGRYGPGGSPFFYVSILVDVGNSANSPYKDANGRVIPIIRGGIQIPLFQGDKRR
ncbi:MAG TPA: hypothetical protein VEB63_03215 [Chitinophagaceae bacterium]|nr:hypothetical protein [Chitinophagaceae bacterium]